MSTAKWIWRLALSILVVLVTSSAANEPTGYFREVCKYRKGKLLRPVTEYRQRLHALREQMKIRSSLRGLEIDAYILSPYDEHLNQEMAENDKRVQYLTGFTGIGAFAVVTARSAAVWVDNRYVQQADVEVDCEWELYRLNDTVTITGWLSSKLYANQRVGADPHLVPHHLWMRWERELGNRLLVLSRINNNLLDMIWVDRPPASNFTIRVQELQFAGDKWEFKVDELRMKLQKFSCNAMIVTSLTEIAYLLNIRGLDLPYTPVVKSYLIVSHDEIFFYVDHSKMTQGIDFHLRTDCYNERCVKIREYNKVWSDLRTYAQIWKRVFVPGPCVNEEGASEAVYAALPSNIVYIEASPIIFMRAQKTPEEQRGMREAHVRDAAAICEAMSILENRFFIEQWTEEKVKYEIDRSRLSQNNARGLSKRSVVAFGEHSALPYYISSNVTDIEVTDQSLLVIESGGQYYEGTTDVSRTFIFGEPTADMKRAYTNVLAGMLVLAKLRFPSNLRASGVDVLVRRLEWENMVDYPQTTGSGIGAYGAVKEPPISIAYGEEGSHSFLEGYFFSSEAGFYRPGEFGVRLKNVLEVVDTGKTHPNGMKFLEFRQVTLVPFEPKLIDPTLLNAMEKRYLNEYNAKVREFVGGELKRQGNMQAFHWMMNKTRHIREYLPEEDYRAARGSGNRTRSFLTVTVPALLLGLTVLGSFLKWLL
ncbi:xaa-Pro aminopeptidase 2 [Bactrocera neohumeralis]|uniref:xaa-Pro aminopeptidase 2 n=1 Tax=Bactrocera neohumeralis TaxID=98809 RepID=UPI00216682F2|nr:xaa-Pro aminopeptidase 2 [Bactrocera neohumeralis]XP_050327021.1 xaa-Pro aminopeptidase 2 [Bactrocera neohumeralis]XP_050327030.1 xaa-Pro aminopeptidase 2 [Bactrocera neohumeralis]XP_050327038.1 xaa-Pro aminopeptidase 2 [Bactrocera neohumeralis]